MDQQPEGAPVVSRRARSYQILYHLSRVIFIMGCAATLGYFIESAVRRYNRHQITSIYTGSSPIYSIGLEITVCPATPFDPMKTVHYKKYLKWIFAASLQKYLFLELYDSLADESTTSLFYYRHIKCLKDSQWAKPHVSMKTLMQILPDSSCRNLFNCTTVGDDRCQQVSHHMGHNETIMNTYDFLEQWAALTLLNLTSERSVDNYDGIYRYMGIVNKHENISIANYLQHVSRDYTDGVTANLDAKIDANFLGPPQEIDNEVISTRYGVKCNRFKIQKGPQESQALHRRYQLTMQYYRRAAEYLLVFVNTPGEFTDNPQAHAVHPYRVSMLKSAHILIYNVQKQKHKTHQTGASETSNGCSSGRKSHTMCIEEYAVDAILAKARSTPACFLMWMSRIRSGLTAAGRIACDDFKSFSEARRHAEEVLSAPLTSKWDCEIPCEDFTMYHKPMGSIDSKNVVRRYRLKTRINHLLIDVANRVESHEDIPIYSHFQLISELLGIVSFIMGVAFVATLDWLVALLLWIYTKLPFIPAMPPLINFDVYPRRLLKQFRHEFCNVQGVAPHVEAPISDAALKPTSQPALRGPPSIGIGQKSRTSQQFPPVFQRKSGLDIIAQTLSNLATQASDKQFLVQQYRGTSTEAAQPTASGIQWKRAIGKQSSQVMPKPSSIQTMPKITVSTVREKARRTSDLPSIAENRRVSATPSLLQRLTKAQEELAEQVVSVKQPVITEQPHRTEERRHSGAAARRRRRSSVYRSAPRRMTLARASPKPEQTGPEPPPDSASSDSD